MILLRLETMDLRLQEIIEMRVAMPRTIAIVMIILPQEGTCEGLRRPLVTTVITLVRLLLGVTMTTTEEGLHPLLRVVLIAMTLALAIILLMVTFRPLVTHLAGMVVRHPLALVAATDNLQYLVMPTIVMTEEDLRHLKATDNLTCL